MSEELKKFFLIPQNCSPTAIVLSLHENEIAKFKFTTLKLGDDSIKLPGIEFKKLSVEYSVPEQLERTEVISLAKSFLDQRLHENKKIDKDEDAEANAEAAQSESVEESADYLEPLVEEQSEEEDNLEGDDSPDQPLEIGTSILQKLRDKLDHDEEVTDELYSTLCDMLKPALVIDGQHRLFGAASVEENIPFLACALVEPEWREQVFQFAVINDRAEGIPKPFITALAGMSLTGDELQKLTERLSQAGVQLWEVEVMQRIGLFQESPFNGLIEFKVGANSQKGLGYQTMKTLGKQWYEPSKNAALDQLMRMLYQKTDGKKLSKKTMFQKWQDPTALDWFTFFLEFWKKVQQKFAPLGMWVPHGSQLMTAVGLLIFQEVFFIKASGMLSMVELQDVDSSDRKAEIMKTYSKVVDKYLEKFEKKHFTKPWRGSLNHPDGKAALRDYFGDIYDGLSTTNHKLFRDE
ncbi:hypothetical protein DB346_23070 [Verrucomicrobia bacterium LW23]|nr:hypothetical protein DB346_23070 [Verrucomicrobia bacterium LW23]